MLVADEGEEFSDDAMVEATGLGRDRFIDKGRCYTRVERCERALELLLTRLSEGIVKGISWRKNLILLELDYINFSYYLNQGNYSGRKH